MITQLVTSPSQEELSRGCEKSSDPATSGTMLYLLLVPLTDAANQPYATSIFDDIVETLNKRVGGCTRLGALADGSWTDSNGATHVDVHRLFLIKAPSDAETRRFFGELRSCLEETLGQQEIFLMATPALPIA
jgi:hypothetical protein